MRSLIAVALLVSACAPKEPVEQPSGEQKPAAEEKSATAEGPQEWPEDAPAGEDAEAARALFDRAVRKQLAGDALGARRAMVELAARHPKTRHGRAASRRLGGGSGAVAVAGVMAAVAIPAFMKYLRRSKSSEAPMNLRRMVDGAVAFYQREQFDAQGNPLPARFPQTTPLAPPSFACVDGESEPRQPMMEDWTAPGFKELQFAIPDRVYYRYQFISEGGGPDAVFTARALGDLDCDGVLSTFERVGAVRNGRVDLGAGLYINNELE